MVKVNWKAVFPALTTQFTAADEIDWEAMERHLEFQLEAGTIEKILADALEKRPEIR